MSILLRVNFPPDSETDKWNFGPITQFLGLKWRLVGKLEKWANQETYVTESYVECIPLNSSVPFAYDVAITHCVQPQPRLEHVIRERLDNWNLKSNIKRLFLKGINDNLGFSISVNVNVYQVPAGLLPKLNCPVEAPKIAGLEKLEQRIAVLEKEKEQKWSKIDENEQKYAKLEEMVKKLEDRLKVTDLEDIRTNPRNEDKFKKEQNNDDWDKFLNLYGLLLDQKDKRIKGLVVKSRRIVDNEEYGRRVLHFLKSDCRLPHDLLVEVNPTETSESEDMISNYIFEVDAMIQKIYREKLDDQAVPYDLMYGIEEFLRKQKEEENKDLKAKSESESAREAEEKLKNPLVGENELLKMCLEEMKLSESESKEKIKNLTTELEASNQKVKQADTKVELLRHIVVDLELDIEGLKNDLSIEKRKLVESEAHVITLNTKIVGLEDKLKCAMADRKMEQVDQDRIKEKNVENNMNKWFFGKDDWTEKNLNFSRIIAGVERRHIERCSKLKKKGIGCCQEVRRRKVE